MIPRAGYWGPRFITDAGAQIQWPAGDGKLLWSDRVYAASGFELG